MEWLLLLVLGVVGRFWVLLFFPGCSASLISSRQQTSSPASTVVSPSTSRSSVNTRGGGRLKGRQTISTNLVSPQQHTVRRTRSAGASLLETQETRKESNECSCDVTVGSNETKEVLATSEAKDNRYFLPGEDFHLISVDLKLSHGTFSILVPKEDLCLGNSSVWYDIFFQAVPSYIGINKWAIWISVNDCNKTFRSSFFYKVNWFHSLRVVANGSSCWRTSPSVCEGSSSLDESNKDAAPQSNAPPPVDHETIILIIVLFMIVIVAFLLIRRKVMSNSRDGAEHPNDPVHQSVSLAEVRERKGSYYDSQNSVYEAWTPDARGSAHDSVNFADTETGTGLMGSRPPVGAGIQEDPIYHNVSGGEVQEQRDSNHDSEKHI